jgi:hypothetical protein
LVESRTSAAAATATAALTAFTFATLGGLGGIAGEGRFAGFGAASKQSFDPAEESGRLLGGRLTAGGNRGVGCRTLLIARLLLLLRPSVALLRALTAAAIATGRTLAAVFGWLRDAAALAAGIGGGVEHRHIAAAHGLEHRAFPGERRCRAGRGSGRGSGVAFVRESGRFPALGRALHFSGRKDVELGLDGGSGGFDRGRDRRDRSGGRSLREGSNNRGNRSHGGGSRGDFRSGSGRSFVRRDERVLVFRLRLHDLNGGGLVGAGGGGVADGGR